MAGSANDSSRSNPFLRRQAMEMQTRDNTHSVRLKRDWCPSRELRIGASADTVVQLECGSNATPLLVLFYITFLCRNYIWLRAI